MVNKETWKDIKEYNGNYKISSYGRVARNISGNLKILKQRKNNYGYNYIGLSLNNKKRSFTVHKLVARHFLGESTLTVNHKNCNKSNNTVENLEWISIKNNLGHATRNKLRASGVNNGSSKLNNIDIRLIKYKNRLGKSQRRIAREMGVSHGAIYNILHGINWSY